MRRRAFLLGFHAAAGEYDIVIYGGTSARVSAAVQARRMGKSVVIERPARGTLKGAIPKVPFN